LGATLQGISATYLTVLILVGARLHRWSQTRPRVQAWGLAATGSAFLLFSAKLVRDAFARVGG
jgi:threonine/homoserine/homoserine lactone efflux protein